MINRDKIIDTLIDDDVSGDLGFLSYMLANGFRGYVNYTDEELIKECEERDISYLFGETA